MLYINYVYLCILFISITLIIYTIYTIYNAIISNPIPNNKRNLYRNNNNIITHNVFNNFVFDENIRKNKIDDNYIIPDVTIKYSNKINSRGVFANKNFYKNDIIEICPCIKINALLHHERPFENYLFKLNDKYSIVGFGYCSMYNHSETPNALWHIINENQISIQILKDIKKDEEILVSYGNEYWETRDSKI
jgi:hypothetical protein